MEAKNAIALIAVVPCFNEEKNIGSVVQALKDIGALPIVVDDSSSDSSVTIAQSLGAVVVRHDKNMGAGAAIRTGYIYARTHYGGDDKAVVLVVAGDGQHDVREAPKLIQPIVKEGVDYVIGERFWCNPRKFGMPTLNYYMGKLLNFAFSLLTGVKVKDSTCGYTAIKMKALKKLPLKLPARAGETHQMLLEVLKAGGKVVFIPITPIYGRPSKISKFMFIRHVLPILLSTLLLDPFLYVTLLITTIFVAMVNASFRLDAPFSVISYLASLVIAYLSIKGIVLRRRG